MDDSLAIKVDRVSKEFLLPHEKVNSIKSAFVHIYKQHSRTREVQQALEDISFEVKKGEFFGIVGRNGSGKSTMLKILAGIYQPTKGKVTISGKLVPFIELGVGFNPELTGRENVYLNGAMLGFSRREIDEMYEGIVAFAELEKFMDQKLKNYSSGMQVRLAFSMATRSEAEILLVDEVLAVGDADFQRKCFDYFRELKKRKKTVVFVSHDMDAVREYCDRAILIEKSKVVLSGRADKVASRYSRMFVEEARSNESQGLDRWGDKQITFSDVKINPSKLTKEKSNFSIDLKLTAHEDVENPLIGFAIKTATGQSLLGTNTKLQRVEIGDLKKDDCISLSFTVPNVLADGHYTLVLAAETHGGTKVSDWWEDAYTITSYEVHPSPYIVSPAITTTLKKSK